MKMLTRYWQHYYMCFRSTSAT